jgi:hypothetical protein
VVLLLPDIQASRILLLAAALAILCSVTTAQYTITDGNPDNVWKCDKTKVAKIANTQAQAQCQGFCDRVEKTVTDLEVEFFLRSAFVRVCVCVLSSFALMHLHREHARRQLHSSSHNFFYLSRSLLRSHATHPHALSHRNRTKSWEQTTKKSFVFKRQLLCGRCVELNVSIFGNVILRCCSTAAVLQQHTAVCCRCCCNADTAAMSCSILHPLRYSVSIAALFFAACCSAVAVP